MIKKIFRPLIIRIIYIISNYPKLKKIALQCAKRIPTLEVHLRLIIMNKNNVNITKIENIVGEDELSETSRHLLYQLQASITSESNKDK